MDDGRCREFFCLPKNTCHRRYEALRAVFVEGRPATEVAGQFALRDDTLRHWICEFREYCHNPSEVSPFFGRSPSDDPPA